MAKCIICLKEDIEETVEHIIPYALGNKHLTIKCVCKKCNSLLGDKIDTANTNNILANFFRNQNNIQGRAHQIPNPFSEGTIKGGTKVRLSKDFVPTVIDNVSFDEETNKYHISTSNAERAIEIIDKKLARKNLPALSVEQKEEIRKQRSKKLNSEIEFSFELDLIKYNLELVKIVYEIFYYLYGDLIFLEEELLKLRQILEDYIYCDKCDLKIFKGMTMTVGEPFLQGARDSLKNSTVSNAVHLISVQIIQDSVLIFIEVEGMVPGIVKLKATECLKRIDPHTLLIFYPNGEIWKD